MSRMTVSLENDRSIRVSESVRSSTVSADALRSTGYLGILHWYRSGTLRLCSRARSRNAQARCLWLVWRSGRLEAQLSSVSAVRPRRPPSPYTHQCQPTNPQRANRKAVSIGLWVPVTSGNAKFFQVVVRGKFSRHAVWQELPSQPFQHLSNGSQNDVLLMQLFLVVSRFEMWPLMANEIFCA